MEVGGLPWITLAQDRVKLWTVVNTVMNRGDSTDFEEGIHPKFCKSFCENLSLCSQIAVIDKGPRDGLHSKKE
jgi:hypothetical protein